MLYTKQNICICESNTIQQDIVAPCFHTAWCFNENCQSYIIPYITYTQYTVHTYMLTLSIMDYLIISMYTVHHNQYMYIVHHNQYLYIVALQCQQVCNKSSTQPSLFSHVHCTVVEALLLVFFTFDMTDSSNTMNVISMYRSCRFTWVGTIVHTILLRAKNTVV